MAKRPPKKFSERNPVPIAIIGLTALFLSLALALNFQRIPLFNQGVEYRAEFTDASGLAVGEEVRAAGIKVGTVRDIELQGDKVVVTFTVEGLDLGDDTEAGIELKSLLGQHFLSVTPAGEGSLPEGTTIPLSRTSTPINIVPTFNRLSEQTAATDTDQVAASFEALAATLESTAPHMKEALTGLSRLSRTVTVRDEEIKELFSRANQVSGVVAARDEELGELLTASDEVVQMLVDRRVVIRRIIRGTRELSQQLTGLVRDNERTLGPALTSLNKVLAILRSNAENIDQILTYAAPYAREFTNVGGSGRWFDATIKIPRGAAVCSTNDSTSPTGVGGILDGVLSAINDQVNGSDTPCIPLGPALGSRLTEGGAR